MKCKCGNTLQWEEGAFCAQCMRVGEELARLRKIAEQGDHPCPSCGLLPHGRNLDEDGEGQEEDGE